LVWLLRAQGDPACRLYETTAELAGATTGEAIMAARRERVTGTQIRLALSGLSMPGPLTDSLRKTANAFRIKPSGEHVGCGRLVCGEYMVRSAESVVIARPVEDVFRYVADLRNEPNWHVDVAAVPPDTDPVPVAGKVYPLTFTPFMGKTNGTFTALEVEDGKRIVYRGDFAGLQPLITYTVESDPDGTRFTRAVEMRPGGLRVLMTPMLAVMVPRRNRIFVDNLKRVLEGQQTK
jgi:uncharacterized protein YndB with AHSA1/START domain